VNSQRHYQPAAQGVERWYRLLGDHWYHFAYVVDGWWGVGETGTLRVSRERHPATTYLTVGSMRRSVTRIRVRTFTHVTGESGWREWASKQGDHP